MLEKDPQVKITPLVQQYHEIKKNYKDTILFFRLGDFYEMFFDDAIIASKELELTLTARNKNDLKNMPMCGIPYHAADNYISRLIKKGYKVAICEQVEDPKLAKKLVKREVIQVVTPGTVTDFNMLQQKTNNYLMSIHINNDKTGISLVDLSTGEFIGTENNNNEKVVSFLENEISRLNPVEIVIAEHIIQGNKELQQLFNIYKGILINKYYDWAFDYEYAKNQVLDLFKVKSLEGFGLDSKPHITSAAGALVHYMNGTQKQAISHIDSIRIYSINDFMELDNATIKNLELVKNQIDSTSERTLFSILDYTRTSSGARLLKRRILEPLTDKERINKRLFYVDVFVQDNILRSSLRALLNQIQDIERLNSRIALNKANPRDLIALKNSLLICKKINTEFQHNEQLTPLINSIPNPNNVIELIEASIIDDPPLLLGNGNTIKPGYNQELDKYGKAQSEGKDWIIGLQQEEIKKSKINSLKIKFNRIFGYYIEITKANLHLVPDYYIRKQTLVNAERFTFPKLQEYEELILSSTEKIQQLEEHIFIDILEKIKLNLKEIKQTSHIIAKLDYYSGLAECAFINNYCKPKITSEKTISIKAGRHPVIEKTVTNEPFIPNDTLLNNEKNNILIITGPNMAGKSTYLRQVALIALMAQIGSFVPAQEAEIGVIDKIFTRIGASDNLSKGLSTFLVEMNETANILNNATNNSLIIMDEIGRGTSTYDGLSIAWAIIEYIYTNPEIKAKTLFATHYHELTQLAEKEGIKNYNILVREWEDTIIFLRKVIEGAADKSYGIQVAKLAGIPKEVIERAKEILADLEADNVREVIISQSKLKNKNQDQLNLFQVNLINPIESEIIQALKGVNINNLTPLEALNILNSIKDKLDLLNKKQ